MARGSSSSSSSNKSMSERKKFLLLCSREIGQRAQVYWISWNVRVARTTFPTTHQQSSNRDNFCDEFIWQTHSITYAEKKKKRHKHTAHTHWSNMSECMHGYRKLRAIQWFAEFYSIRNLIIFLWPTLPTAIPIAAHTKMHFRNVHEYFDFCMTTIIRNYVGRISRI